ncbi:MAG: alpha/beta fold hydrolase [Anaerolineales bacterium]|nr:alpha/beta fold hydrolase [Anaerolineales bacterium]
MKNFRYWRNLTLFGLLIFALFVATGTCYMARQLALNYLHPRRLVLPAEDTPAKGGIPFEDVTLTTADHVRLDAWYTPPQNGVVILSAHGYGGVRHSDIHIMLARQGYGVLSWDFRAHGKSGGEVSTLGYYEMLDVEAALAFALQQPGVAHIGAWGGSMGGATLILATAKHPEIEALVSDSAYASLRDEMNVAIHVNWMRPLIGFFAEQAIGEFGVIEQISPVEVIGQISPRPVMIIQGLADSMIPVDSGKRLYVASGQPHTFWSEEGVEHVQMLYTFPERYEQQLIAFFDAAFLPTTPITAP